MDLYNLDVKEVRLLLELLRKEEAVPSVRPGQLTPERLQLVTSLRERLSNEVLHIGQGR